MNRRVYLIHWQDEECAGYVRLIGQGGGFDVTGITPSNIPVLRDLRKNIPDALVISLDRMPLQGRDVAMGIRASKATRYIPLVFAGGKPDKVEKVRQALPDAVYCEWPEVRRVLTTAIANPPVNPVRTKSALDAYAGTPLCKKLAIKKNFTVALVNAPPGFADQLGDLPFGVKLLETAASCDLLLWFARSRDELELQVEWMASFPQKGTMWIVWPKRNSRYQSDLTERAVREAGLAAGLVDYKVCSVDQVWSGLLFTRRKA